MLLSWFLYVMSCNLIMKTFIRIVLSSFFAPEMASMSLDNVTSAVHANATISGSFLYHSSINFDKYLKELGVPYVLRTLAGLATPLVTVSERCSEECIWTIQTDTLFKSHKVDFRLGETKTDTTMDGRVVKFVVRRLGNTLIETQTNGNITTIITRNFDNYDQMRVYLSVNDVNATSVFYRHNDDSKK